MRSGRKGNLLQKSESFSARKLENCILTRRRTMRNPIFRKTIPLIAILILLTFSLALAADKNVKTTRGKVATVDFKAKVFAVNESKYTWNRHTTFSDEKGIPLKVFDRLKPKALVFIEWEPVKGSWERTAKRVCIYNEEE
jgi:hypothetical protein